MFRAIKKKKEKVKKKQVGFHDVAAAAAAVAVEVQQGSLWPSRCTSVPAPLRRLSHVALSCKVAQKTKKQTKQQRPFRLHQHETEERFSRLLVTN